MSSLDWNVVVTAREEGYNAARRVLSGLGAVERSGYFNVLLLHADDPRVLLETIAERARANPDVLVYDIARVLPLEETFEFDTAEQFREQARAIVMRWTDRLGGKRFHVRVHRRGMRGEIASHDEERALADIVLEATAAAGCRASVAFDDPDAVLDVEIVSHRGGMAIWTREELQRFPFLHPD